MGSRLSVAVIRVTLVTVLTSVLVLGMAAQASAATIVYVNASASGANNGTSWANAYKDLQSALAASASGEQIWVAKGTYKPGALRAMTFSLRASVAIYGGFAGGETLLSQRKPNLNVTILSGDIGVAGDPSDNSFHVVVGSSVDSSAVLDGFTITGGNANGSLAGQSLGGGLYDVGGSPALNNLKFVSNQAALEGGGAYLQSSNSVLNTVFFGSNKTVNVQSQGGGLFIFGGKPTMVLSKFLNNYAAYGAGLYSKLSNPVLFEDSFNGNTAAGSGGGMYSDSSTASLKTVQFRGNTAVQSGAGMYISSGTATLLWVTFANNNSSTYGGGLYNDTSSLTMSDTTFNNNTALVGAGMYNYQSSPAIDDTTFSGNQASDQGGGMLNSTHSYPVLYNMTFSGNQALPGAGGAILDQNFSNPSIHDSIFWGDSSEVIDDGTSEGSISLSIMQGGDTCAFCSQIINRDPKLGPLQNNGGQTQTMSLGVGSAAIDADTDPGCISGSLSSVHEDERGVQRPQGPNCDLGAYEVQVASFFSQAANDGWVLESGKGTSVGGGANSTSANFLVGDNSADKRERGFLSFNTASLADTATVVRARVRVMQAGSAGNPFITQGRLMMDLAKPYFGSSAGLAASDYQAGATVAPAGNFGTTLLSNGSWYFAGLNATALANINKLGTTQFRLRFATETYNEAYDFVSFFSSNAGTVADWPVLTVYYNP